MNELNSSVIIGVILALLVGGIAGYYIAPEEVTGLTDAEINAKISNAVEQAGKIKNTEIDRLRELIDVQENATIVDEPIEGDFLPTGYVIDGLYLSDLFVLDTFSDREITQLFDGKVDFDGKDYDAEETLTVVNISLEANENDFDGNVYMTVPKGAVEYKFTFENDLGTSLIDDEDTLEFSFLGDEYEVTEWDTDTITLTKGIEYQMKPTESIVVDNKTVTLEYVTEDAVWVDVDGVGKSIDEDKTRTVNGLKIKVTSVFESATYSAATLIIGEEIEVEIEDGDEYAEDSAWEYIISANSIGLALVEDFTKIDEDFEAIGVEKTFCLPNDYVCVQYNGMSEEDVEEYSLDLYDRTVGSIVYNYTRIDGNFQNETSDYNKVYVNSTGIYDKKFDLISVTTIELADSDSVLNISTPNWIVMEDFRVNYDLNASETHTNSAWTSLDSEDEDYLTDFGLLVINPKDAVDDEEFNIFVPEERLEGSISFI